MSQLAVSDGQPGNREEPDVFLRRLGTAVITFILGEISIEKYGNILLYCGIGSLVIGLATGTGSKRDLVSPSLWAWKTSQQQEVMDTKHLQSSSKGKLNIYIIGAIPIVVGYLLAFIFKA